MSAFGFPWRKQKDQKDQKKEILSAATKMVLEQLESRVLMSISGVPNWTEQGPGPITNGQVAGITDKPVTGAINAIVTDPANANTVYVGTVGGGVWKTTTALGVMDWEPKMDQFPSLSITALALYPTNASIVWAGTGSGSSSGLEGRPSGIFKSADGGTTWKNFRADFGAGRRAIRAIVPTTVAQGAGRVVLVAGEGNAKAGGLLRSTNGGVNGKFERISGKAGSNLPTGTVTDVVGDPSDPDRFYAAVPGKGIYRTENAGATWTEVNTGLADITSTMRIRMSVAGVNAATGNRPVYAALAEPVEGKLLAPHAGNVITVAAPATFEVGDEIFIYVGATNTADRRTVTAVATAGNVTALTLNSAPVGVHAANDKVVRTNGGWRLSGVYRSEDLGANWVGMGQPGDGTRGINPGGQADRHFSILADKSSNNVVFVGGDRHVLPFTNGATDFTGRLFRGVFTAPASTAWSSITDNSAQKPDGTPTGPHADSRVMIFDKDNNILQGDDGGIYKLVTPNAAGRVWQSVNGDLRLTELYSVAYDRTNNTIIGGAQDNGVALQNATNGMRWTSLVSGDGAIVQSGSNLILPDTLYYSSQGMGGPKGWFKAKTGPLVQSPTLQIAGSAAGANPLQTLTGRGGTTQFDPTVQFVQPYVLNSVSPGRMLVGTQYLYESIPSGAQGTGDVLKLLGGPNPPALTTLVPAAHVGVVKAMVYGGREPNGVGGFTDKSDVGYVGTLGNGKKKYLFMRQAGAGTPFVPIASWHTKAAGNTAVVSVAVDPDDWHKVYVLDKLGRIWFSDDGGSDPKVAAGWQWEKLSDGLAALPVARNFQKINVYRSGTNRVLLAGGEGGLFRRIDDEATPAVKGKWHEFGAGLSNAMVTDIDIVPAPENLLLIGTLGRGAWTIPLTDLDKPGKLTLNGGAGGEVFELQRDLNKPWQLNVFQYPVGGVKPASPTEFVNLTSLESITIDGGGGDDEVIIDSTRGAISVPGGITVKGNTGTADKLTFKTPAAGTRLAASSSKTVSGGGTTTNTSVYRDPMTNGKIVQQATWDGFETAPVTALKDLADPIDVVGTGLASASDAFQDGLAGVLGGSSLAALDPQSLAGGLNGTRISTPRAKDDAFLAVSQVNPDSLAQIDNATSLLRRIFEEGALGFDFDEIDSEGLVANLGDLVTRLDALDSTAANVFTLPGDSPFDGDTDATGDVRLVIGIENKRVGGVMEIDVDAQAGFAGVRLTGEIEADVRVDLKLVVGVDSDGFYIEPSSGVPALRLSDFKINGAVSGSGHLGFLGVDLTGATLAVDPNVKIDVALTDPGTEAADSVIRIPELAPADFAALLHVNVFGNPGGAPDVSLTGNFAVSAMIPGIDDNAIPLLDAGVELRWANLSDPTTITVHATADSDSQKYIDFLELTSQDMLGQLKNLRGYAEALSNGPLGLDIPLIKDGLDSLIDVVEAFDEKIVNPLTGGGGITAEFSSAQELAVGLASHLGLDLADIGLNYDAATKQLNYHVDLDHSFAVAPGDLALDFGLEEGLKFATTASGSFGANVQFAFDLGVDIAGLLTPGSDIADNVFVRNVTLTGGVDASITSLNVAATLGFLEVNVVNGTLTANPRIQFSLNDGPDDRINLSELVSAPGGLVSAPVLSGTAAISLPLGATTPFLNVTPSGDTTVDVAVDFGTGAVNATLPPIVNDFEEMFNFTNTSPSNTIAMLRRVIDLLLALSRSKLMEANIPFTDKSVGEILDYGTTFKEEVLDALFASGDAFVPDANGDGSPDLNFDSIQSLISRLSDSLGINLNPQYNAATNEMSFSLAMSHTLGFGDETVPGVATLQEGDATHNEIQTVTVANGGTFRLGFLNGSGPTMTAPLSVAASAADLKAALAALPGMGGASNLDVTRGGNVFTVTFKGGKANTNVPRLIPSAVATTQQGDTTLNEVQTVTVAGSGTFRLGFANVAGGGATDALPVATTASQLQTALQEIVGNGNVTVARAGNVFTITFVGALSNTNVPELTSSVGELPLDFGVSLGDIAGLKTDGAFTLLAGLHGGMKFVIDLDASEQVQIAPAVFTPQTGEVEVESIDGTAEIDEVATLTVNGQPNDRFKLAFRNVGETSFTKTGAVTLGATEAATAASILSALKALPAIGDSDVTVAAAGGNIYTITFVGALAKKNVQLASDDGILSSPATFTVDVANLGSPELLEGQFQYDPQGQLIRLPGSTFHTSPITVTVNPDATNATLAELAADVQAAVDHAFNATGLTLGFNSLALTTAGVAAAAAHDSLLAPKNDWRVVLKLSKAGEADLVRTATLRQGRLIGNTSAATIATELQTAINTALSNAGAQAITVNVTRVGGKLTFQTSDLKGQTLTITVPSVVVVSSGGGRISLTAPSVSAITKTPATALDTPETVDRLITIGINSTSTNPAFKEMGLLSAPTPQNGRLDHNATFTLSLNNPTGGMSQVTVTLTAAATAGNTSINQLVTQLQAAVSSALGAASLGTDLIEVIRLDPNGNRVGLVGKQGVVTRLSINVPDSTTNGAITGLGFESGQGQQRRGRATEFYLQDVSLTGSVTLSANDLEATATLGFLGLSATGQGVLNASAGISLKDPVSGSTKVKISNMAAAIGAGLFLFDANNVGDGNPDPKVVEPTTGVIDGFLAGNLTFGLDVAPTGAIAGLEELSTSLDIDVASPNLLLAMPALTDPYGFGKEASALTAALTLDVAAPSDGRLTQDLSFIVIEGTHEAVGILRAADTAKFTTRSQLQSALQGAVNAALARLDVAGGASDHVLAVAVDNSSGQITFTRGGGSGLNIRSNTVNIDFDAPDLEALLNRFRDLSFEDILQALRQVVALLRSLDGSGGGGAIAAAVDQKLPLVDRSISEMVDIAAEFGEVLDAMQANPAGSIQTFEKLLREKLGIPASVPQILAYEANASDTDHVLKFNLSLGAHNELSRPFNLNLADAGLPSFLTSLVGVTASGTLGVEAGVDFDLKLGFDLDDNSFFVYTGATGTRLFAEANAGGNDLDFSAKLGPFGLFVTGGSASLDGSIEVTLANDGDGRLTLLSLGTGGPASELGSLTVNAPVITGTAEVDLPLFIGTEDNQVPLDFAGTNPGTNNSLTADINLVKLLKGEAGAFVFDTPDFDFDNLQAPSLFALISDPATIVGGLDRVLLTIQDALNGQVFGKKLPFVGDLLKDNPVANVIEGFRQDFLQPLANGLRESNLDLDGLIQLIRGKIFDIFNSSGFLKNVAGNGPGGLSDVLARFLTEGREVTTNVLLADALQFDFNIGKRFEFTASEIGFDLGIPALGLNAAFTPRVTIDFNLHFGFGVDDDLGFYFVTDNGSPEMSVEVKVDFSGIEEFDLSDAVSASNPAPATVGGRLLFLALELRDGIDLNGDGVIRMDDDEFSKLFLNASLNLDEPSGDGRLTFPELISSPISTVLKPTVSGGAMLRAHAEVDFSTIDPSLADVLPSISTDILVDFGMSASPTQGFTVTPPSVALADVTLDLGSFISDFAGPVLRQVADILGPLDFLIGPDGFLNMRIPLLSELAGKSVTGKDLIILFDPENGPKVVSFLNFVEEMYFLVDLVNQAATEGDLKLNFGDLVLTGDYSGPDFAALINKKISLFGSGGGGVPDLRTLQNLRNLKLPANLGTPTPSDDEGEATSKFTSGVTKPGGIEFNLLKPETIFKLIMGQPDVTLVTVELPEFGFNFLYRQEFPIFGPLVATFAGGVGANIDLGFGYDTRGLSEFMQTKNPLSLLKGFFLNDLDPATGMDRAEATLRAQLAVGAALSLGIAKAGVEGGIEATIFFNLADLDDDGKIRYDELASNLIANSYNPLAIFDVTGQIEFFLRAYLEINLAFVKIKKNFEFARLKLFEFNVPFNRPPVLASASGGVLTINVGPNAAARLRGDTSDTNEIVNIKTDGDSVVVWGMGVAEGDPLHSFKNITKVVINGGAGNDQFFLTNLGAGVVADIRGGEGNDLIVGGAGADNLFGDGGNDTVHGGAGNDTVSGGTGDDDLAGGAGNDTVGGDAGNDAIDGGHSTVADAVDGDDILDGGPGDDTFTRGGGNDIYNLNTFGSTEYINGTGAGSDLLDFSGKQQALTFFLTATGIEAGFNLLAGMAGTSINHFASKLIVLNAARINRIIGGDITDTFYVTGTDADGIILDGRKGDDRYNFSVGNGIKATVTDTGDPWNTDNVINIVGTAGADDITVSATAVTFGTSTVTYTPPAADGNLLQLRAKSNEGNDRVTVSSTSETVPVRVDGGGGNDTITVGAGTLDNIRAYDRPGLGKAQSPVIQTTFGVGPLVLVGGPGHDTVVFDDSADNDSEAGNLTAFTEPRDGGIEMEVGVLSGLGMGLKKNDPTNNTTVAATGRAEFEQFETVDVRMGSGSDKLSIGGDSLFGDLPVNRRQAGGVSVETLTQGGSVSEVQKITVGNGSASGFYLLRLGNEVTTRINLSATAQEVQDAINALQSVDGVTVTRAAQGAAAVFTVTFGDISLNAQQLVPQQMQFVHTIHGQTIVSGGSGADTVGVRRTNSLTGIIESTTPADIVSKVVSTSVTTTGVKNTTTHVVNLTIGAQIGYFVLEFADPAGTEAIPGAMQTVALPYNATAAQLRAALEELRLVGPGFVGVSGSNGNFIITFNNQLGALPQLLAMDPPLYVDGGAGNDEINLQSIEQTAYVRGGADNDDINVNVVVNADGTIPAKVAGPEGFAQDGGLIAVKSLSNGVLDLLTVDGGAGSDDYVVYHFGGTARSQINMYDSGAGADGNDEAAVMGTNAADMFLLRAAVADDGLAFIAMLKPPVVGSQADVERVNYRNAVEQIDVFALDGDDAFGIDDTRAAIGIYGGAGRDFFQVGQLYKSERQPAGGVRNADIFATIETTRGFLSNGISEAMTIHGGGENDEFVVYHNLAPLVLNGDAGDDSFLIRAFALVGSQEDLRERTDVSGDAGADLIQYAVNAPVNIDGGDGFDTVIVIGTEFNDDFVITENGVFGAGLNIRFVRVEKVEVDAAEGDDRFYILGTAAGRITQITGGLGSDTFNVNGPTPPIVSNDLLGHSGLISHTVSADGTYAGTKVEGIAASIADNDEPAIRILVPGGAPTVSQALQDIQRYAIVLTRKPENGATVLVKAFAPRGLRFKTVNGIAVPAAESDAATLSFTDSNWNVPQEIQFAADDSVTLSGIGAGFITHSVDVSGGAAGTGVDGDAIKGLFVQSDVAVGDRFLNINGGLLAFYGTNGLRGATIKVISGAGIGQVRLVIGNNATQIEVANGWGRTLDNTSRIEILRYAGVVMPAVAVNIVGDDAVAIDLRETGGSTFAVEAEQIHRDGAGFVDAITLALSKAPAGNVTLTLDGGGQVEFAVSDGGSGFMRVTSLSFNTTNWDQPRTVYLIGKQDALTEGFHKGLVTVTAVGGGFDAVSASLVADVADDEVAGVLVVQSDGSTLLIENNGTGPTGVSDDSYRIVLTKAPDSLVTVNLIAEATRTQRGAGTFGIRSFTPQLQFVGGSTRVFTAGNWFNPQEVTARAIDDNRVDGGDSKSFPTLLEQANKIEGPLFIVGGVSEDRSADLEREPIMLVGETNFKPSTGTVAAATSYSIDIDLTASDITALESKYGIEINSAAGLKGLTIEITRGPAKNKFRVIMGATHLGGDVYRLVFNRPWEGGLTPAVPTAASEYTLEVTNPNLLVDENEETDFLTVSDADNVTSYNELPTAELTVTANRLTGLGMGVDQLVGGRMTDGGITYNGLESLFVNLGSGANRVTILDTHGGQTHINAGAGADVFDVRTISGHTFLNAGAGADAVTVGNAGLLAGIGALLTVTGDVPQVIVTTLGKGSAPDAAASVEGANEVQQLVVDATGGTFSVSYGGQSTPQLAYNVSAADLQAALEALSEIGSDNVLVGRFGNTYRVEFRGARAGQDMDLLGVNDRGLSTEGPGDTLTVNNTADPTDNVAVLNPTSLTGLGMGGFGTAGTAFNEIQTLRVDADGGTFVLSITVNGVTTSTPPLAHNVSAADLDTALEAMLEAAYGLSDAAAGAGVVEISRADDVYVFRFVGVLTNRNVEQIHVNDSGLVGAATQAGGPSSGTSGRAHTATRVDGITAQSFNEVQRLNAPGGGTFRLRFGTDLQNVTSELPFNLSAATLQLALEALDGIAAGDVKITDLGGGVFDIEFTHELSALDVPQLVVQSGGGSVSTQQAGRDSGMNDVQVLVVNATGGTFTLSLYVPGFGELVTTNPIAFEASADAVRQALQHGFARSLANLTGGADLSAVREAFKTDFMVTRVGNSYFINFLGKTRQSDGGSGVSSVSVDASGLTGGARVLTRMDGIDYYGFERFDLGLGSGADVLNVQGTSAGSYKLDVNTTHAATNVSLGGGDDEIYVSSDADLDHHNTRETASGADVFEFLTGNLDQVRGNLNLDAGTGRHRLLVSDEGATAGDGTVADPMTISDAVRAATGEAFDNKSAAEIQVKKLAFGDITYGAAAAGDFYGGVVYWTGSGNDAVNITGTHVRAAERTVTQLNTGLGNDHVTVDLDDGEDGYFVLHTMGGALSPAPGAVGATFGDDDTVRAADSTLPLVIFGGLGNDDITAGQNRDVVFGDFGRVQYFDPATGAFSAVYGFGGRGDVSSSRTLNPTWAFSTELTLGGGDTVQGHLDQDLLIGGAAGDLVDGDEGDDLVFGDAVQLLRRPGVVTNPRFQTLAGTEMYGGTGDAAGAVMVDGIARNYRNQDGTAPYWAEYEVKTLYHSAAIEGSNDTSFGNDYIAGGAGYDQIFAQLGNDTVQGDGSIESAVAAINATRVGAVRMANGTLALTPTLSVTSGGLLALVASFDAATDGDDYVEGGGGDDVLFGNLGQDDLIGGSSSLFTLTTAAMRPDGRDFVFGGSGTQAGRNAATTGATAHARDADVILGDNGNILRLVGLNGVASNGFLTFNYDNYGALKLIPRAAQLLDYTAGGPDFDAASAANDIGGADELHGEGGDDAVYGMKGNDVLFGDGEDDDLIGGWGNDWISGGTGQDGVLGDDGRIFTSRNSTAYGETLYGIGAIAAGQLNLAISSPGNHQEAVINVGDALKKTADLTPFNLTPKGRTDDVLFRPLNADDVIYGGLGGDFLHGGAGDDAVSGAEAMQNFFDQPTNVGNILRYNAAVEEFADYDENAPMSRLSTFLLNFDAADGTLVAGSTTVRTDGDDAIFGDLGHDWIVGGTGRDNLYGGYGSDLLNADDDQGTGGGANVTPDTHPTYADRAYGGAGRDVMIANTAADRLIDWSGEYNSFLVPFRPFGESTITRMLSPRVPEFLYDLSKSDGADPTRTEDGTAADRNGEPYGELGVVLQPDADWGDQHGGPADPQAGNNPGQRDVAPGGGSTGTTGLAPAPVTPPPVPVVVAENFADGIANEFAAVAGSWSVAGGRYTASTSAAQTSAVSLLSVPGDTTATSLVEYGAKVSTQSYGGLVFDYVSATDFKFAAVLPGSKQLVIGHRTAAGWVIDAVLQDRFTANRDYALGLSLSGGTVSLKLDGADALTHTFTGLVTDGELGLFSKDGATTFDDVSAKVS